MIGPSIRRLLTEELLTDLQTTLSVDARVAEPVVNYLRALRELYHVSVAKELNPEFGLYIDLYKRKFTVLFKMIKLPWTLKQHIICDHLGEYFTRQNITLRATSGEYIESVHSSLRRLEEIHGLHTETQLGTQGHMKRLLKSSCLFNFKNEGFRIMDLGVPHDVIDEFWNDEKFTS